MHFNTIYLVRTFYSEKQIFQFEFKQILDPNSKDQLFNSYTLHKLIELKGIKKLILVLPQTTSGQAPAYSNKITFFSVSPHVIFKLQHTYNQIFEYLFWGDWLEAIKQYRDSDSDLMSLTAQKTTKENMR